MWSNKKIKIRRYIAFVQLRNIATNSLQRISLTYWTKVFQGITCISRNNIIKHEVSELPIKVELPYKELLKPQL